MILSMTGYAVASRDLPSGSLQIELRAVNHRFLDLFIRVPDELRPIEPALREKLTGRLARGKIECRVAFNRSAPDAQTVALNTPLVAQLHALSQEIARAAPGTAPLSAAEILRWPGVVVEPAASFEDLARLVEELADAALDELTAMRGREGGKLALMIEERLATMETLVARVSPRLPAIQASYSQKLTARLRDAALDADEERLRQELALFAAKIDVAEEVSRLGAHIGEVRRVLKAGGNAGKRLDFLMQELNREANTLASKSVDAELSQIALELKVLIEQMREQVQNLE